MAQTFGLSASAAQASATTIQAVKRLLLVLQFSLSDMLSGCQLLTFLQQKLVGLTGMAVCSTPNLAITYGLAGSDPLERCTVALVTRMRNMCLAT